MQSKGTIRKFLLACGILASVVYVGTDVLAAIFYDDYHSFTSQMVSELMASGAPTEALVDPLFLLYGVLMMAFGVGVWISASERRTRIVGALLFGYAAIGLLGPTVSEMHLRGTGSLEQNIPHIVLTVALVVLTLAVVWIGSSLRGRWFRVYSLATLFVIVSLGAVSAFAGRAIAAGDPTPWLGLIERILIGAFLLWVGVLAVILMRVGKPAVSSVDRTLDRGMPTGALPVK